MQNIIGRSQATRVRYFLPCFKAREEDQALKQVFIRIETDRKRDKVAVSCLKIK